MNGFKQFLLRGNVVDLAVGVVIGAAFGGVVTALVKDLTHAVNCGNRKAARLLGPHRYTEWQQVLVR